MGLVWDDHETLAARDEARRRRQAAREIRPDPRFSVADVRALLALFIGGCAFTGVLWLAYLVSQR